VAEDLPRKRGSIITHTGLIPGKQGRMKILWIKSDYLYPADTGGKIRSYNILKNLAKEHQVSYLCLADDEPSQEALDHLRSFCERVDYVRFNPEKKFSPRFYLKLLLNLFSPRPYVINKYLNSEITREIERRYKSGDFDLLLCDFLEMSINTLPLNDIPKVLFQHNVESEIWRRHYLTNRNLLKKAYLFIEYRKFRSYEKSACALFDNVLVVSESDARIHRQEFGIDKVSTIPTGVDTEYFSPHPEKMEKYNITFVGSMDWLPNQDAMEYFITEIYPKLKLKKRNVKLYIVGRRPPEKIVRMGEADDSVTVTGTVDDVRPYVDRARVYIVPIRIGGGTRIKIFEALAQKKAVVSTTVGAEGLPLADGREILIRDDPDDFADTVSKLIEDDDLLAKIASGGHSLVTRKYNWKEVAKSFATALREAVKNAAGKDAATREE
jgi:sugar transferase (PEP-CTERM/EpsH1 system associated)